MLAPLLGSLFLEYLTWRWIFYINVPICLASLLLLIPYKEAYEPRKSKVNYLGSALFGLSIGLLLANTVVSADICCTRRRVSASWRCSME